MSETSLFSQLTGPRKLESRSVSATEESMLKGERDREESVGQTMRDRKNLHKILHKILNQQFEEKNGALRKLSEIQKSSCMRLVENLNLKGCSFIKRIYGPAMLKEKEKLCGELEMRNELFQESRTNGCQEIEELRRRRYEESDRARKAKLDELSMKQQKDPQTVSQLLTQMRELQDKSKFLV